MMEKKMLKDKLCTLVAGETIDWHDFERYMNRAAPATLSTLMKAVKVEAYLAATQDKILSPKMKIAIGAVFAAMIVVSVVYLIFTSGGSG